MDESCQWGSHNDLTAPAAFSVAQLLALHSNGTHACQCVLGHLVQQTVPSASSCTTTCSSGLRLWCLQLACVCPWATPAPFRTLHPWSNHEQSVTTSQSMAEPLWCCIPFWRRLGYLDTPVTAVVCGAASWCSSRALRHSCFLSHATAQAPVDDGAGVVLSAG